MISRFLAALAEPFLDFGKVWIDDRSQIEGDHRADGQISDHREAQRHPEECVKDKEERARHANGYMDLSRSLLSGTKL